MPPWLRRLPRGGLFARIRLELEPGDREIVDALRAGGGLEPAEWPAVEAWPVDPEPELPVPFVRR